MKFLTYIIALILLVPAGIEAQSNSGNGTPPIDYTTARLSRVVRAVQIDKPITIDGRLDEDVWRQAEPAKDFTQGGRSSNPGNPSSQQTEVRFLYDSQNLYMGATLYEKDIKGMIVNGLKRDFISNQGDEIGIVLDTLNDDRSGFFFSTNPAGAKRDLQVSNDNQMNQEWDGVWDVRVTVGDDRWAAEFIVPFKTLRFSDSPSLPASRRRMLDAFEYVPRNPETTVLYQVVAEQLETFLSRQQERDRPVPRFVEKEFRSFLDCGILARGFLRLRCSSCGHDRLLPYSCKRRGWCPSCGGRRMADTAAHLVDDVFPVVPLRQWVLSLPFALRYRMAYDARLTGFWLQCARQRLCSSS